MSNTNNDIDALLRLWSESARSDHRRYHRALTALVAERDALKVQCDKRFDSETIKDLLAERDALKKRVAELEALSKPVYISQGQRVESIDLRERLVCAALTGVMAHPTTVGNPKDLAKIAVAHADAAIAAMRKGESDGK